MCAKYDRIGIDYNQTRKADAYLTHEMLRFLRPTPGKIYLDIGCGTGNYTDAYQKKGYSFIGIDPSIKMLEKAKNKNRQIKWQLGTAENTGLEDDSVDGITASLTIHHWSNLDTAFSELSRILKPGGNFVIFTSTPHQMEGYWLNAYFPKMMKASTLQMPSMEMIKASMHKAGFDTIETVKYFVRPDVADKFLYAGKHDPESYLEEGIRRGISSFSTMSNHEEVTKGLAQLQEDVRDGKIHDIIEKYENTEGDYLFVKTYKK